MRCRRRAALGVLVGASLLGLTAAPVRGAAGRTPPGPCSARVAVLGADLSAGGRFEVQRALRVGPHTRQLTETLAEEQVQAQGLIPPALLGRVAVSSGVVQPRPAGAGLQVHVAPAITLDTAQTYANALLTAGVTDALVRVAAPTAQPALGTTALLGLLRAAQATCVPLDPARVRLALREAVVASGLEAATGVGRPGAAPCSSPSSGRPRRSTR